MAERITIIDFVEKYSHKYENFVYLREKVDGKWKEITQGQTREEAYRIGAGLMSLGVKKGDRIALLSESRAMWILAELGAMYAGATDVPLSVNLGEGKDLVFRINHSEAKWILVSGNHLPKIRAILPECPAVEKVIVFDDTAFDFPSLEPKEMRISEIQKMGAEFLKAHRAEFEARYKSIGPDDYANISYTSGTTADPKGILLTHRNYTANVEQGNSVISINEGEVMLIILPLDHPPQLHRQRGAGQLRHQHQRRRGHAHHPPAGPLLRPCGRHVHHDDLRRLHRLCSYRQKRPGNAA